MRASLCFHIMCVMCIHTVINLDRNKKIKLEGVFIVLIYTTTVVQCILYRVSKDRD